MIIPVWRAIPTIDLYYLTRFSHHDVLCKKETGLVHYAYQYDIASFSIDLYIQLFLNSSPWCVYTDI